MKKAGLKDMRQKNIRMIMDIILNRNFEEKSISRIELAEISGLSPSTVSSLTSELMERGYVTETGETESTGGRKRRVISVNKDKGYLALVEITWRGTSIRFLNFGLDTVYVKQISDSYARGNDLFTRIIKCLQEDALNFCNGNLLGIGLMFQADMKARDFQVLYSTSLSSSNITLRGALETQFKVPTVEDFSQEYSLREILTLEKNCSPGNSIHIEFGKRIFVSLFVNGIPMNMADGKKTDITPYMEPQCDESMLTNGIVQVLKVICMLFSIERIYLSGKLYQVSQIAGNIERAVKEQKLVGQAVEIKVLDSSIRHDFSRTMSQNLLQKIKY